MCPQAPCSIVTKHLRGASEKSIMEGSRIRMTVLHYIAKSEPHLTVMMASARTFGKGLAWDPWQSNQFPTV